MKRWLSRMKWSVVGILILACAAGAAETVILGVDATSKARRVLTDSSGRLQSAVPTCVAPAESNTSVGVTATSVPATPLANRSNILVCNSDRNATGTITCRIDGGDPTSAAASLGQVLVIGRCISYSIPATVNVRCISDAAGTRVLGTECQ